MHNNLFDHCDNRKEVYTQLAKDLRRDIRTRDWIGYVAMGALLGAALEGPQAGWMWLVIGLAASVIRLDYAVDASNRNFLLHQIDWNESNER